MKKGQVWIETVIYTLIAFIMITAVLSFVRPKIQELQDKALIEQSIEMMGELDATISSLAKSSCGNKRSIELTIKKGTLKIDSINEKIIFSLESAYEYSESGEDYKYGNILIHNKKIGKSNELKMTLEYNEYDIIYDGENENKELSSSPTPHKIFITHQAGEGIVLNIKLN